MSNRGKLRRMFPGGNTSVGFYSYYDYIIEKDATRILILKGGPGVGKSLFMKRIGEEMLDRGFDVEYHHCSSDNGSLDGVCIPSIRVALMDGTAPHIVDPKHPGVVDEIINLGEYWNEDLMKIYKEDMIACNKHVGRLFGIAYSQLREARIAYDEWSGYIEESMDLAGLNRITAGLIDDIYKNVQPDYSVAPKKRHLFGSAITPNGPQNYIDTLLDSDMSIYAIKGDPGTSVNEVIARVADKADLMGLPTEQFHCPFIPEMVDLVIIPGIRVAVVNISYPMHLNVTEVEGLNVVRELDLSNLTRKNIIYQYLPEIEDASQRYKSLLNKAISHIQRAKIAHDKMEAFYIPAMDFDAVNKKRELVLERIVKYALSYNV